MFILTEITAKKSFFHLQLKVLDLKEAKNVFPQTIFFACFNLCFASVCVASFSNFVRFGCLLV